MTAISQQRRGPTTPRKYVYGSPLPLQKSHELGKEV